MLREKFGRMQKEYLRGNFKGEEVNLLLPLSEMFEIKPIMLHQFAEEAKKAFMGLIEGEDFQLNQYQLAYLFVKRKAVIDILQKRYSMLSFQL
jgi:hypothetical protein